MYSARRTGRRPPRIIRRPRKVPLSRLNGDRPGSCDRYCSERFSGSRRWCGPGQRSRTASGPCACATAGRASSATADGPVAAPPAPPRARWWRSPGQEPPRARARGTPRAARRTAMSRTRGGRRRASRADTTRSIPGSGAKEQGSADDGGRGTAGARSGGAGERRGRRRPGARGTLRGLPLGASRAERPRLRVLPLPARGNGPGVPALSAHAAPRLAGYERGEAPYPADSPRDQDAKSGRPSSSKRT